MTEIDTTLWVDLRKLTIDKVKLPTIYIPEYLLQYENVWSDGSYYFTEDEGVFRVIGKVPPKDKS